MHVHTNCKRYCAKPHYQQEDLCEVLPLSRSLHIQSTDPCALQVRKHNRYLLADVRFCLCLPVAWDRSCDLRLRVGAFPYLSEMLAALKLIYVSHTATPRLSGNSLHPGRTTCKTEFPKIVFYRQHSLLITSTHVGHPRLKKQRGDILRCFSSRLCDSGLVRRACELLVCFVTRS